MEQAVPQFEFGGKKIDLVVKTIPQMIEYSMENVQDDPGSLKIFALRNGVKSITVNGKPRPLMKKNSEGNLMFELPDIRDEATRKGMGERILPEIVKFNDFLAFDERFSDTFSPYLPDDEAEEDPTEEEGSSTGTSTPPEGGPSGQTA